MRESSIERKLVQEVKTRGGICPKWVSPGLNGVPDRIVLLPRGDMAFVEVKAPGKNPRPIQLARHRALRRLGYKVYLIDAIEQITPTLDEIGGRHG